MSDYAWAEQADRDCEHSLERLVLDAVLVEPPSWSARVGTCADCGLIVWFDPNTLRRFAVR